MLRIHDICSRKYFARRHSQNFADPASAIFLLKNYACDLTNCPQVKQFTCFPQFATLTIPDSKPYVEFFSRLGDIISHFENKPIYQSFEQKAFQEVIP